MAFRDFPEQQQGVQLLQRALERGRLAHGYLFSGDQLDDLETLARNLAKTLNCQNPLRGAGGVALDACDKCLSCSKIENFNHSDVYWVRPESKTRVILIDQIRELMHDVYLKPSEAKCKVAVVVGADRLNVQAANAFLKTLEEPPSNSILILLTTDPERVLETILSRCLRLNFSGRAGFRMTPPQLEWLSAFAAQAGVPQKSLLGRYRLMDQLLRQLNQVRAATEETMAARSPLQQYEDAEKKLKDKWESELSAAVEAEYRRQRSDLLAILQAWLRDVWIRTLAKASGFSSSAVPEASVGAPELLNFPEIQGADLIARRLTPVQARENLQILEDLQRLLRYECSGGSVSGGLPFEVAPVVSGIHELAHSSGCLESIGRLALPAAFRGFLRRFPGPFHAEVWKSGHHGEVGERSVGCLRIHPAWALADELGLLSFGILVLASIPILRWEIPARRWLILLPLVWCCWQLVAAIGTRDPFLTGYTVKHFVATVFCFYLGFFGLSGVRHMAGFWLVLIACFLLVLASGWSQHFGGLDQTRRYFFLYVYPQMKEVPPDYLKKMASDRIFGTLFYPNTLAGVIILLLPPILAVLWNMRRWMTGPARGFLVGCAGLGALSCLYWSGSKGGWLLMLLLALLGLLRIPFSRKLKGLTVAMVLLAGIAGFALKYRAFFEKGATSVVARFDYWRAALVISRSHPWVGTGPGTFGAAYQDVRDPRSEPARLAHNDYLQQLSDSGVMGCLTYTGFVGAALVCCFPRNSSRGEKTEASGVGVEMDSAAEEVEARYRFGVWLGLFGWFVQGLFDFSLYVPGSAWLAFALLGYLLARSSEGPKGVDKASSPW